MSAVFQAAVLWVIKEEGGLHDDPTDPGGLTNMGIALAEHPEMTADEIRNLTIGRATEIYHDQYWAAVRGDDLPPHVAWPAFDSAVNQGAPEARLLLQKAAGVAQDEDIGPATIRALAAAEPRLLVARFTAARDVRYTKSPRWLRFGEGWVVRATLAAIEGARYIP